MTEPDERDSRDVRALLGTALRGEPPSTLDAARLTKLGKRRLRLQRAGAALGVVMVAGGIALGTGLLRHNGTGPDQISAAATSSPPAPTSIPVSTVTSSLVSVPETPIALAEYVVAEQNAVLKKELGVLPAGMSPVSQPMTFIATKPSGPINPGYAGSGMTTRLGDRSGTGDFIISADVTIGNGATTTMSCDASMTTCAVQTIDGISVEVETDHPTARTTRIFTVALSLSGSVLVNGTVDNLDSPKTTTMTRPTPPLTADQLATITAAIARNSP